MRILTIGGLAFVAAPVFASDEMPPAPKPACVADSLGELRAKVGTLPDCSSDQRSCRDACLAGNADSCLAAAYAAQATPEKEGEAALLFHHGCILGLALACTNYAASIWANEPTAQQLACARQLFRRACAVKEAFACGMSALIALAEVQSSEDLDTVRRDLEGACAELGGFPCRVLAKHLEAGDFGPHDADRIKSLLEKACRSGDPDACGQHPTAAETFH